MISCPHCQKLISQRTENKWFDELPPNGQGQHEVLLITPCCKKQVKFYCEFGKYELISEPLKEGEKPQLAGWN